MSEGNTRKAEPGASLANAPDVQRAYDDAGKATEPLQPATPGPDTSRMSAAQRYDPIQALETVRDQQPATNNNQVPSSYQDLMAEAVAEYRDEQGLGGSQMVRDQQPTPRPSNTMPEAKAQDAQTFDDKWKNEQSRADAYQDRMAEAVQEQRAEKQAEPDQDQEQEQGRGI